MATGAADLAFAARHPAVARTEDEQRLLLREEEFERRQARQRA